MSPLRNILFDFTQIEGVNGATITVKDGFVIEQVMPASGADLDAPAAMITTLYGSPTRLDEEITKGEIISMSLDGESFAGLT